MSRRPRVLTIVGTRPEVIKLSRVIPALDHAVDHVLLHTGQNYDYALHKVFFDDLGLRPPDHQLACARATPIETIAAVLVDVDRVLEAEKPDAVLIYGDTNSAMAAIAVKKRGIPLFHMEAGNRSFDQRVPEELNRTLVDHLSDVNMTITEHARRYLLAEGLPAERVVCVGSSMREVLDHYAPRIEESDILDRLGLTGDDFFLVSVHREENVDDEWRLRSIVDALMELRRRHGLRTIVSTHPRTRDRLSRFGVEADGIEFLAPLGFFDYVRLQKAARCVLSDSGTITEEAALLGLRAITIRDAHERPEGPDAGVLIKAPVDTDRIVTAVDVALQAPAGVPTDVAAYAPAHVSRAVTFVILSNIDYVNRVVWHRSL